MDASRAREQLRRRYLFPRDTEAPLDSEGYAGPGEALPPGAPRAALRCPESRRPETAGPADLPQPCPGRRDQVSFIQGLPSRFASRVFSVPERFLVIA